MSLYRVMRRGVLLFPCTFYPFSYIILYFITKKRNNNNNIHIIIFYSHTLSNINSVMYTGHHETKFFTIIILLYKTILCSEELTSYQILSEVSVV